MKIEKKIKVAILGATGSVGQKFVELLSNHPWFEINELAASERSANKKYSEACNWILATPLKNKYAEIIVKNCVPNEIESEIVFSGLDASVAGEIETKFAQAGKYVISNARNHRFDPDVPLIIPEVNSNHLELIETQTTKGKIITNPNCSTIGLVLALKPLHDKFGIEKINVVTMQAVSGAGYPGISILDMLDNLVPYIGGEEEKMQTEPLKILAEINDGKIELPKIEISAQCNRVPVIDGHLETVQIKFKNKPTKEEIISAFNNFKSEPQKLNLPTAPKKPIYYFEENNFPQPRLHRNIENGMAVSVGRLRECNLFDYKFIVLSHNTIRGAAGGTILNAELLLAKNLIEI